RVLHASWILGDGDLGVLVVRIRHAGDLGEELHGLDGLPETSAGVGLAALFAIEGDGHVLPALLDLGEAAGGDADQVDGMWAIHAPMPGRLSPDRRGLHERPVADDAKAFGHRDAGLRGALFLRVVMARIPMTGVLGLALTPDLDRVLGVM